MAEQILTQIEVDALMKGLSSGDIKAGSGKERKSGGVRAYSFSKRERLVKGKMPTLEMVNEKFCRNLRGSLFTFVRKSVDFGLVGIKPMRYEEFFKNLRAPSSLNIFQLAPLRGQGLLVIEPELVFFIVDRYFGGDGSFRAGIDGRDFTKVEQTVIKKVVELMLIELNKVWKPVYEVDFGLVRTETDPKFVNIVGRDEVIIVSTFQIDIEAGSHEFCICLPYSTVEPIKDKLFGFYRVEPDSDDGTWGSVVRDRFLEVPLALTSELGSAGITVGELIDLKVGDVIKLDKKVKDPLELKVEGVPKYCVTPGVLDNNYSLKIVSVIERGRHG